MVPLASSVPRGPFLSSYYAFASKGSICKRSPPRRAFRTTAIASATHYDVLSLPKSATRSQIKARFYKLSKDLHPDLNPSKDAKERYLKVSEAYNILGDEKRRSDYDRSLQLSTTSYPDSSPSTSYPSWMHSDLHRRRGATHAWERHRRSAGPGAGRYGPDPHGSQHFYSRYNEYTMYGTAKRRGSANANASGDSKEDTPEQRVSNESVMWRVVQVVGVLWLVVTIGGGWSAHS